MTSYMNIFDKPIIRKVYLTVYSENKMDFDEKISTYLDNGWELYANPYLLHSEKLEKIVFYQAMIKIIVDEPVNKS